MDVDCGVCMVFLPKFLEMRSYISLKNHPTCSLNPVTFTLLLKKDVSVFYVCSWY